MRGLEDSLEEYENSTNGHLVAIHIEQRTEEMKQLCREYSAGPSMVLSSPTADTIKWFPTDEVLVPMLRRQFPGVNNVREIDGGWLILDARERLQTFVRAEQSGLMANDDEECIVKPKQELTAIRS